jgi:uncharacterized membrane protein YcaP (DUF421 family)
LDVKDAAMETIEPFDWQRMLLGETHPLFLIEILLRIAVIWPWTMLLLRWVGGRSVSQLSLVEFLLVIALGSAVGDALFYPEVPLIHAMLVIFLVIVMDKLVDQLIRRFKGAKTVIDGQPVEVVHDGVILCPDRGKAAMGNLELMELLRLKGVENLGSVRRAYLEPSGQLSIFPAQPPLDGLPIVPPVEIVTLAPLFSGTPCCTNCGQRNSLMTTCTNCGADKWMPAVRAPQFR